MLWKSLKTALHKRLSQSGGHSKLINVSDLRHFEALAEEYHHNVSKLVSENANNLLLRGSEATVAISESLNATVMRLLRKLRLLVMIKVACHSERSEESQFDVSKEVSKKISTRQCKRKNFKFPSLFKGRLGGVCRTKKPYTSPLHLVMGKINKLDCFAFASAHTAPYRKFGFTLAEVLITLGIIGVVAVLTLPTLIQHHKNTVVETRLAKFYSTINQAIALAELDYGDREYWFNLNDVNFDKDGNPVNGNSEREKWVNKYIAPYIKNVKSGTVMFTSNEVRPIIYFADGSALVISHTSSLNDYLFFPGSVDKCLQKFNNNSFTADGKCLFKFNYSPTSGWEYIGRTFEPYKYGWNGTEEGLYDESSTYGGCNGTRSGFCTALIQYNGWKIPKNYPYKVSY